MNLLNISASLSAAMPMPVSVMEKARAVSSPTVGSWLTRSTTSPDSVNLTAFPTRFIITCLMRSGSPIRFITTCGSMKYNNSRPFSWALMESISKVFSTRSRILKFTASRSSRPASILDMSRMSFIRSSSDSPAFLNIWT
ncbi:MAG: hypothetical protein ACD_47C00055G0002 [uncultured bacterium]|nr:MAG: hypothetical protein ACD_47C00055G0002 [uncultured bacterium]